MDTNNTAQVDGDYTSLPFGDGFSVVNTDDDTYHFAGMDYDYNSGYSGTAHAQFRQYNNGVGSWMSPDRYSGSYDFGNPQSLNRYAYVGNNPLSATDPSGLVENNGGGPGGGDWCDATDPTCDPGGCDPLFYDCNGYPGYGDGGSWEAPEIKGYIDLDPHHIMTESLGLPAGMQLPSGDILDIFGIGSGTCEFGVCGGIGSSFQQGASVAGTASEWCTTNPQTCAAIGAFLARVGSAIAAPVAASAMLLSMQGDRDPMSGANQNIVPTWAGGAQPIAGESASEMAQRLCKQRYPPDGAGCGTGPTSERNMIRKWAHRKWGI